MRPNTPPAITSITRYDPTTICIHWLTVVLIASLWILGQTADLLPKGPMRTGAWSTHVLIGFACLAVIVVRITWRASFGRKLPPPDSGFLQAIAKATHYGLYLLITAALILGVVNALYRGFAIFGVLPLPQIGNGDPDTRRAINGWHELAANAVVLLAFFHAMAALAHHYLWRDNVLERMLPPWTK